MLRRLLFLLLALTLALPAAARTPPRPGFKPGIRVFGSSFILDQLAIPASSAYSTRRLSGNYAGFALRVIRSSDTTTSDIGFTAAGDLNTTALLAFCAATDCNVTIQYDQSGNGRNATPSVGAEQPRIVSSGSLYTLNSKAAIRYESGTPGAGNYRRLLAYKFAAPSADWTYADVGASDAVTGNTRDTFWTDGNGASLTGIYLQNDAPLKTVFNAAASTTPVQNGTTNPTAATGEVILGTQTAANLFTGYRNAEVGTPTSVTWTVGSQTSLWLGAYANVSGVVASASLSGYLPEHISWAAVLSAPDIALYLANAKTYWGTP